MPIRDDSTELESFRAFADRFDVRLVVTSSKVPGYLPGNDRVMFVPMHYTAEQRGHLAADLMDCLYQTASEVA